MILDDLLVYWDFQAANALTATSGERYTLTEMDGPVARTPHGIYLQRGQWLRLPRAGCPPLNIHGPDVAVTIVAHIRREPQPETYDCETIAGMWDESLKKRQYCLFLDLPIWDSGDQVGGHVSSHGGPTPGHKYCMDAAIGATVVPFGKWQTVGFTYDGASAKAYLQGKLDFREGRNPFDYPKGLYDGGKDGADFTVGAVSRSGEPGNFFHGALAHLAVFDRALTDDEMHAVHVDWRSSKQGGTEP